MTEGTPGVYIFHGSRARFAAAVYENIEQATNDIRRHRLSGVLTWYPVGKTVYEYAVENGYFLNKPDADGVFIQSFTSASLDHYHFNDGNID